ncbi:MAG TPA: B12-binding domain-containing protein [Pyrinomonadaceae bacterium]|nr:B12-binding domain-containing protein [Pyrinomonadaceae bacterium]
MSDSLTTKGVAKLLRVSEATVKRWTDSGLLQSDKTAGGHRRFRLTAVASLRRELGIGPGPDTPSRPASQEPANVILPAPEEFANTLLRADEKEAGAVLVQAYLSGAALTALFDETITPAMHHVGELWFKGSITVADEHLATRIVFSALQTLTAATMPVQPTGLKAICCGIEGDLHELPVQLARIILESEGWEVQSLGPNTPLFALTEMVARQRPQLVGISARSISDPVRATAEYRQLRKVTGKLGASVAIGGEGFRDPEFRERFPSEFYADNFAGFAKFTRALIKERLRGV